MRINVNKINKVFENLNNKSQIDKFLKQRDKDNEVVYLIPFKFESLGTANTTEAGIVGNEFEINDFTSYAKLLTGLDNIIVKWDEAYNVYIDEEANKDLPDIEKFITKEYKRGRVIKCTSYQDATGSNTISSPVDSSFKQIEINENIIVKTNEKLKIDDIIKVYLIPQKNKWRWLYLANMTEYYDKDNKYIGAEIQLSSVNSIYSQSGGAIEQFIQKSAPGEGYAFPKWNNDKKEIELDETRAKDLPVQAIQREYSGAACFNTIYCYGRPTVQQRMPDGTIQNVFNPKIKASRLLLPYKVQTPKISPINTKPSAETDYYLAIEANPTMNKYYSSWKEQFQANYDLNLRKQYEGVLELPKESELEETNPIDDGTHRYILWDNDFQVRFTNKEFNTETNKLTNEKIVLNGSYTISEILAHNSFITNHLITMPMNTQTNTTWNLRDIPIIGGFLNTITLGIPLGWTNTNARVKMGTVMLLTPANLVKYGNQLTPNNDKSLVPFDLLQENTADLIQHSGIAGMGSSIKLLLTDEFIKDGKRYNTVQLGQPLEDGTILKWDGNCKPVAPINTAGYVIDILIDRTISKTNCRTVFTSSQYEVFQSTYKTKSKFTNEIRDWTNQIKFSSWSTESGTIRFPNIIQQPNPPQVDTPLIEIEGAKNTSLDFNFNDETYNYNLTLRRTFGSRPTRSCFTFNNQIITRLGVVNLVLIGEINGDKAIELPLIDNVLPSYDYSKIAPNINQLSFLYESLTFEYNNQQIEINVSELVVGIKEIELNTNQKINFKTLVNFYDYKPSVRDCFVSFDYILEIDATENGKLKFRYVIKNLKFNYHGLGVSKDINTSASAHVGPQLYKTVTQDEYGDNLTGNIQFYTRYLDSVKFSENNFETIPRQRNKEHTVTGKYISPAFRIENYQITSNIYLVPKILSNK